jgi:ribosomal protein L11 methylase PrmA
MLRFADFSSEDRLYDLGCGNGSIAIAAAKCFGSRAVGVDADPQRVLEARANADRNGVGHLVEFHQQDAREIDLTSATVVTLHLGMAGNLAILKKLRRELPSGARVVSRDFPIPVWAPDASDEFEGANRSKTSLFLWRI